MNFTNFCYDITYHLHAPSTSQTPSHAYPAQVEFKSLTTGYRPQACCCDCCNYHSMDGFSLGNYQYWSAVSHAIDFKHVTLGYDKHPAVLRLQAEITSGSLTAVVGPNGAGKSTLLKGVVGILSPLAGTMSLGSIDKAEIAYLPQQSEVDRSLPMTVMELVAMGLWRDIGAFNRIKRCHRTRIQEAISAVGLIGFENRPIGSLSGGQMQRALFARLLLQDAQLVLLDEPFNSIDTRTMNDLLRVIRRWHSEGRTVLAVLHDVDTVRLHFPQTLMLARELVDHGPTAQVLTADNQFRARQMCEACDGPPHTCGRVSG